MKLHKVLKYYGGSSMVMEALEMVRARLFCTVRQDIVSWVDRQVVEARFRNRSHAIEYALIKLKESDERGV